MRLLRRLRRNRRQWLVADAHRAGDFLAMVQLSARALGLSDTMELAVALNLVRMFEERAKVWAEAQ